MSRLITIVNYHYFSFNCHLITFVAFRVPQCSATSCSTE